MDIKLGFYGAAGNVTGSRFLLQTGRQNILIDCGIYQEHDLKSRNWEKWPILPAKINAVLLTHAHLDHCGLLPRLVKDGFRGPIYCTEATADIAKIVLLDSARLIREDLEFKKRRHERENRQGPHPYDPIYTEADVRNTVKLFKVWNRTAPLQLAAGLEANFIEVGHILGASAIRITVTDGHETRKIVFSGDIGRWDMPILRDPAPVGDADYLLIESTYGNRIHGNQEDIPSELARIVNDTAARGGNLIIPSFAVERTQDLLYHLAILLKDNRIPHLKIYIDSPMAVKVNEIFLRHPYLYDMETTLLSRTYRINNVEVVKNAEESKALNHIRGTAIIIAGSGMCTGGRIKHHLAANIERPESTILFVGYQAANTLGRIISDGAQRVRILGEEHPANATIAHIDGFSAHADSNELMRWMDTIPTKLKKVFVIHGEPEASRALAEKIEAIRHCPTCVPNYTQEFLLE